MRTKQVPLGNLQRSTKNDHAVMIMDTDPLHDFYVMGINGIITKFKGVRAAVPVLTPEEWDIYAKIQPVLFHGVGWVKVESKEGRYGFYKDIHGDYNDDSKTDK